MKKSTRILALLLLAVMLVAVFASCGKKEKRDTLVVGYSPFNEKFSPFFSETAYDADVWSMTQLGLLTSDRTGAVIEKGINGTTVAYNGTDYTYYGPADLTITENTDGSVNYDFTLRQDLKFSDGTALTIDDVIFTMYVYSDPAYDGSSSFFSLPIQGMKEYREGWDTLLNLIYGAGRDNTDYTNWTAEKQTAFWTKYDAATLALAQEIVDYCVAAGAADEGDVAAAAAAWGFEVAAGGTMKDFADALEEAYGADVAGMIGTEAAGSTVDDLFPNLSEYSGVAIKLGDSADNITGIQKTGANTLRIVTTKVDATAIYKLGIPITPLHYYGNTAKYDYANNKFGFDKGDLSTVRAKTTQPMGAGPYKFVKYENGVVNFEANELYFKGVPKTKYINFQQCMTDDDKTNGVITGTIDITDPSFSNKTINQILVANGGKLKGDTVKGGSLNGKKITTNTVDNPGYGYIGMCATVMNVGGVRDSAESKALRKAFGTILSVYRELAIDSYYGDRASVINYPISNTSWAAPQATDTGYKVAFSVDVNGNPIYTSGMTDQQKYAAALEAAKGFFKAAGYTWDEAQGKFTAAPTGASLEYEAWIPGDGTGDHPSFQILTEASKALKTIGITLKVKDLTNSSELWTALKANQLAMWCAAWQSDVDPDMYQIYFSGDADNKPGGSNYQYQINDARLNELILAARGTTNQAARKTMYKECLDIIVDWAVEIPVYQRQNAVIFSTKRVNLDTVTPDITTFYGWLNEIENIEMK
ncbi:MAG: ABC transporter substrate-binding protein [Clostridia bacterium]|nr:ABC transporter substrate-binding protein [Clostridia bacterium]